MRTKKEIWYLLTIGLLTVALIGSITAWSMEVQRPAAPQDCLSPGADCEPPDFAGGEGSAGKDGTGGGGNPLEETHRVAKIGDRIITLRELYPYAGLHFGGSILKQMLNEIVLDMEGDELNIRITPQEVEQELVRMQQGYTSEADFLETMQKQLGMTKEAIERDIRYNLLLEKIATHDIIITETALQEYFAQHPEEVMAGVQLHIVQIIFAAEEEALEAMERLKQGIAFEDLAAAHSTDAMFPDGDLGWVEWDDPFVLEPILERAQQMIPGQVSGPIALPDGGYGLIKLQDKKSLSASEREQRKETIRKELALEKAPSLQDVLVQLWAKYHVTIIDPDYRP